MSNSGVDEERVLLETLRKIEILFARTPVDGERGAAASAMERIRERLRQVQSTDPPIEMQFRMTDYWSQKLCSALLARYGIKPYRYSRQRHTTLMARIPKSFCDEVFWPEFQQLSKVLREHLDSVTDRIIRTSIHAEEVEAEIVPDTKALPAPA